MRNAACDLPLSGSEWQCHLTQAYRAAAAYAVLRGRLDAALNSSICSCAPSLANKHANCT